MEGVSGNPRNPPKTAPVSGTIAPIAMHVDICYLCRLVNSDTRINSLKD